MYIEHAHTHTHKNTHKHTLILCLHCIAFYITECWYFSTNNKADGTDWITQPS